MAAVAQYLVVGRVVLVAARGHWRYMVQAQIAQVETPAAGRATIIRGARRRATRPRVLPSKSATAAARRPSTRATDVSEVVISAGWAVGLNHHAPTLHAPPRALRLRWPRRFSASEAARWKKGREAVGVYLWKTGSGFTCGKRGRGIFQPLKSRVGKRETPPQAFQQLGVFTGTQRPLSGEKAGARGPAYSP